MAQSGTVANGSVQDLVLIAGSTLRVYSIADARGVVSTRIGAGPWSTYGVVTPGISVELLADVDLRVRVAPDNGTLSWSADGVSNPSSEGTTAREVAAAAQRRLSRGWDLRDLINLTALPIPAPMSSPPTITRGVINANSTIVPTATTAAATIQPNSSRLTWAHGTVRARAVAPTNFFEGDTIDYGGGIRAANYFSNRFMTDATAFDVVLREQGSDFIIWVDGQPVSREVSIPQMNSGSATYYKCDFGADVLTYRAENVAVTAGGSGYAVGDLITLTGGTFSTAIVAMVSQVSAGAVVGVKLWTPGDYSVIPASPMAQGSTTGSGTGATISPVWGQRHTTRRWRRIEIFMRGAAFGGINVPAGCTVLPWPVGGEKWLCVADSIGENTYSTVPASTWDDLMAQSLGVFDNSVSHGIGAVGYVTANGSKPNFLGMIPNIVSLAPTRLVVGLGINDEGQSAAAIQANVAAGFAQLMAALPNCIFFCIGPWVGKGGNLAGATLTVSNAIKVGIRGRGAGEPRCILRHGGRRSDPEARQHLRELRRPRHRQHRAIHVV